MIDWSNDQRVAAVANEPEDIAGLRIEGLDDIGPWRDDLCFSVDYDGLRGSEGERAIGFNIAGCFPYFFSCPCIEGQGVGGFSSIECEDNYVLVGDGRASVTVNGRVVMIGVGPEYFALGGEACGALVAEVDIELG